MSTDNSVEVLFLGKSVQLTSYYVQSQVSSYPTELLNQLQNFCKCSFTNIVIFSEAMSYKSTVGHRVIT